MEKMQVKMQVYKNKINTSDFISTHIVQAKKRIIVNS